ARTTSPATGGALVLVGMLLVALNLRAAVTGLGAGGWRGHDLEPTIMG
ncbi:MFS transporter, partial [Micromonospora globispora]